MDLDGPETAISRSSEEELVLLVLGVQFEHFREKKTHRKQWCVLRIKPQEESLHCTCLKLTPPGHWVSTLGSEKFHERAEVTGQSVKHLS